MLLQTDESLTLQLPAACRWDVQACMQGAMKRYVLGGTMLRTLSWTRQGDSLTVSAVYAGEQAAVRQQKQMLSRFAGAWYSGAAGASAEIQVLMAHDLLCRMTVYDDAAPFAHDAYGALCCGAASCDGYAEAFALLTETAGIPVQIVSGRAADASGMETAHAWNLVQLDGVWYHLDCTWDDTGLQPAHTYFLCSDAQMQDSHTWDQTKYPPAEAGGYRYEMIVQEMADALSRADGLQSGG